MTDAAIEELVEVVKAVKAIRRRRDDSPELNTVRNNACVAIANLDAATQQEDERVETLIALTQMTPMHCSMRYSLLSPSTPTTEEASDD